MKKCFLLHRLSEVFRKILKAELDIMQYHKIFTSPRTSRRTGNSFSSFSVCFRMLVIYLSPKLPRRNWNSFRNFSWKKGTNESFVHDKTFSYFSKRFAATQNHIKTLIYFLFLPILYASLLQIPSLFGGEEHQSWGFASSEWGKLVTQIFHYYNFPRNFTALVDIEAQWRWFYFSHWIFFI